jgi:hypothetical protein
MDHSQYGSRIVYPRMPEPLTESDLACLFTVSLQEDHWARTVARKGPSLVALLTHLKVFQHVGRFLPIAELPAAAMSFVDSSTLRSGNRSTNGSANRSDRSLTPY